ncbi:hypothetical protein O9Z70_01495 [Devosia sp. YIM 151766]|uniref:hypothetical protein n=1 Tax=Devosia sp. YIM 151766 TaxID=3017325 RepID=UPI00255C3718|nr:hypothetical protein [Devosia sp. YIM 151766]WIY53246.1 hypothetical protein O9Z70_01495 [Devosia sp. YIM 151766]
MQASSIQPYLVANDVDASLAFYTALGFEIVRNETFPYRFAEVRDKDLLLLMSSLAQFGGKKAFGAFIVTIPDLAERYAFFTDNLRHAWGGIPLRGLPRITRLSKDGGQFRVFDPAGNMLVYMDRNYAPPPYAEPSNAIDAALANAWFNRDIYANDAVAAKILDRAIALVAADADPIGRARLIGARAEIAVAMGEADFLDRYEKELTELSSSVPGEYRHELLSYKRLAQWMVAARS